MTAKPHRPICDMCGNKHHPRFWYIGGSVYPAPCVTTSKDKKK